MPEPAPASPEVIFDLILAYQRSAALKAAIDLDLFTAIADGAASTADIAERCHASLRGTRILCDYLVTLGLLTKDDGTYRLEDVSAAFLSQRSPTYLGSMSHFLNMPGLKDNFDRLTDTIRRGSVADSGNTVAPENPIWVQFARAMVPMMVPTAHAIAGILDVATAGPLRVLDIAAGHGIFGITLAERNPEVRVSAVDWKAVLAVAGENAAAHGVADRYETIAGDAFTAPFGSGYDVALVTNFLHHFDHETCISFLSKVRASMTLGGRVVVVEMVPNPDRVTPPVAARFSLTMLAGTPAGDAYTFDELRDQLEKAGFGDVTAYALPTPQTVIVARAR